MVLANPLNAMHSQIDLLPGSEFCNEDVGIGGADGVVREGLDLTAGRFEYYV